MLKKKLLVCGATGFIGKNLAKYLCLFSKSIEPKDYKMIANIGDWTPKEIESSEIKEFKGPF